jgi:hypothetical protein
VTAAVATVFRNFNALTVLAFILRRRIVASTTFRALHINDRLHILLHNFRNHARTDGSSTFADSEAKLFFHRDWGDEFNF